MSDEQVRTAIDVLKAYIDGSLATDLIDDLDRLIDQAFAVQCDRGYGDDEEPIDSIWPLDDPYIGIFDHET